jgi:hypothetical protein
MVAPNSTVTITVGKQPSPTTTTGGATTTTSGTTGNT